MRKNIVKQLFCKHRNKQCITNIHGDLINLLYCRSVWECVDCGRHFKSKELKPECSVVNFTIDKTKFNVSVK